MFSIEVFLLDDCETYLQNPAVNFVKKHCGIGFLIINNN